MIGRENMMKKRSIRILSAVLAASILCPLPVGVHAADAKMSIRWQGKRRSVAVGKKLSLKVKIQHKKRGTKLLWKSSSKKIATVSKQGVVSGKKAGKVKITVRIQGTAVKRSCTVRVTKPAVSRPADQAMHTPMPEPSQTPSDGTGNGSVNPGVTVQPADPAGQPDASVKPAAEPGGSSAEPGGSAVPTADPGEEPEGSSVPTAEPGGSAVPSTGSDGQPGESAAPLARPDGQPGESARPDGQPGGSAAPSARPDGQPGESAAPTAEPTGEPSASVSPDPVYVPGAEELVPYFTVTEIQGETMTVYLIHKNYEGQVHVSINGKEFTAQGNAKDALMMLAYGGTVKTDSAGRLRLSRQTDETGQLEAYWTVEDLVEEQTYQMRAESRNKLYPDYADCGVIYFRGDVTSVIEIY